MARKSMGGRRGSSSRRRIGVTMRRAGGSTRRARSGRRSGSGMGNVMNVRSAYKKAKELIVGS